MVTVEINIGFIMAVMILFIIYLIVQYWFAVQELHQYQQWYEDTWHKWSKEMRENIELREKLNKKKKEED